MALMTETYTRAMEARVRRAARHKGIINTRNGSVFFEHGQWWVENVRTGAQWSVVDCQTAGGVDYLDFEQVSEGDQG